MNKIFEKLCTQLQLGEMVCQPLAVAGGLLHRMYALETTTGKYAVKALNPQVMLRPTALPNMIYSEKIAAIAAHNVPALPAKRYNDASVQQVDDQYFLVFDWVAGRSLKPHEITIAHAERIGGILAAIHKTDFSSLGIEVNGTVGGAQVTDWNHYVELGETNQSVWVSLAKETVDQLYDWSAKANQAAQLLASSTVISHMDLDAKNVLWHEDKPLLIDWEASGPINPMQNLTETAIYWSTDEAGNPDRERFLAFLRGYKKQGGTLEADWKVVLAQGFAGMLGWLEYNFKRSLWLACTDEQEQQMGTEQVLATMNSLRRYAEQQTEIEGWLNEEEVA
ncbi:phosphotransferase [Paenibacillus sp. BC26]|uniref:phosphotransferase n=1 Tax=Paenibacillus sp. BC26 TaxID=1881032 RepID=UPI0008E75BB6|nr:phosphotransferase [Paenibacillus sp. BC26]SFT08175.1 Predicted kinase, aminoglycoside phosphotransferase (APT) family [Paenibacillus sp. BC26]